MKSAERYQNWLDAKPLQQLSQAVGQAEHDRTTGNHSAVQASFTTWEQDYTDRDLAAATPTEMNFINHTPGIVPNHPEINLLTTYLIGLAGLGRISQVDSNGQLKRRSRQESVTPQIRSINRVHSLYEQIHIEQLPETTIHGGTCAWPIETARDQATTLRYTGDPQGAIDLLSEAHQQAQAAIKQNPSLARRSALAVVLSDLGELQHILLTQYHAVYEMLTVSAAEMNLGRLVTVSARAMLTALDYAQPASLGDRWDTIKISARGLWRAFRIHPRATLGQLIRVIRTF